MAKRKMIRPTQKSVCTRLKSTYFSLDDELTSFSRRPTKGTDAYLDWKEEKESLTAERDNAWDKAWERDCSWTSQMEYDTTVRRRWKPLRR